ncbi:helix-turn-helix domain-containing protein [Mycobacteroides abscessus]|uniref:helix-turn-helix domain-containing protein n=1 Tax=Mycobacteroides abscessus TaxID=36809 RepID=UPI000C26B156|nr:helix-turn-helix transcriptional regulator [Mycobacteroides abscessus]
MPDFAERLSRLFAVVHPAGRGPHTLSEVAAGLSERGVNVSIPYLSMLRSGERTNPSPELVEAIAGFFQVSPAYFYDPSYAEAVDRDLDWVIRIRDSTVREIAARSHGLSNDGRRAVVEIIEHLRRAEGIVEDSGGSD